MFGDYSWYVGFVNPRLSRPPIVCVSRETGVQKARGIVKSCVPSEGCRVWTDKQSPDGSPTTLDETGGRTSRPVTAPPKQGLGDVRRGLVTETHTSIFIEEVEVSRTSDSVNGKHRKTNCNIGTNRRRKVRGRG